MATLKVLTGVILLVSMALAQQQRPAFCRNLDCPTYESTSADGYEIRTYVETKWITTYSVQQNTEDDKSERYSMFSRLLDYLKGENTEDQKIPMTAPVVRALEPVSSGAILTTLMFYVNDPTPPGPLRSKLQVVTKPAGEVFVREFEQQDPATEEDFTNNLIVLQNAINDTSLYGNFHYRVGYNSPFFPGIKHYEVWLDKSRL